MTFGKNGDFRPKPTEQPASTVGSGLLISGEEEGRQKFKERIRERISQIVDENKQGILSSAEPLKKLFDILTKELIERLNIEGLNLIPKHGSIILAANHQFGWGDFSIVSRVLESQSDRPWAFVGNSNTFSRIFPEWENDPKFSGRIIPVRRETQDSSSRIINGSEVVEMAVDFLRKNDDSMLFITPEGADVNYQSRIGKPKSGLGRIARMADALIVPVAISGDADLDKIKFNLKGEVCKPFSAQNDDKATSEEWLNRIITSDLFGENG